MGFQAQEPGCFSDDSAPSKRFSHPQTIESIIIWGYDKELKFQGESQLLLSFPQLAALLRGGGGTH